MRDGRLADQTAEKVTLSLSVEIVTLKSARVAAVKFAICLNEGLVFAFFLKSINSTYWWWREEGFVGTESLS